MQLKGTWLQPPLALQLSLRASPKIGNDSQLDGVFKPDCCDAL